MQTVPVQLVGQTYINRSLSVSNQETKGFYLEVNPSGAEPVAMMPFPGLKAWSSAGSGKDRGFGRLDDVLYKVSGTELYRVTSAGVATLIGTIPGTNRCRLEADDVGNLVIANGIGKPYSYNGTTLTQGTDSDLPNASTVAYINNRMLYESLTGSSYSDLDTPLTVNSANILKANTYKDNVMAVVKHRQQLITFCSTSNEPAYFVGSGTPPYARVNNAVQKVGTIAKYSLTTNNNFIYFLDNLKHPSRMTGLTIQKIGNPAIGSAIEGYSDVSDCFTVCFTFDNQNFCLFQFPTGNASWLFAEESQSWTSLSYGINGDQHLISDYMFIYNKHLVSDRRNGNIYELDFDTFTDNGDLIQRRRTTSPMDSRPYGLPGKRIFMSRLQIIIESGVSLVSSIGTLIMEMSDDNGRSWSGEAWHAIGEQGDYTYCIEWFGLGEFYTRMFRFTMTDPIKWVLISAHADIEVSLG